MAQGQSHTALIWKVFGILSFITIIEVILGIYKPDFLFLTPFMGTSILNWIFLILTIVKAYYIVWYFMHLGDEKKNFRTSIVLPLLILIPYLSALLLIEGSYLHDVLSPWVNWNI
ncbi:MAG: cytochrome C oxidase subunit IV family protein [Flavobacteriaceae bacterium]